MSEEGAEAGNKKSRYDYFHHTRKDSDLHMHTDLFVRDMATGDMEIADIMYENNRKKKNVATCQPPKILPTAARPLIKNQDDFVFMDIEEPEPDPSIYLDPTDDEDEDMTATTTTDNNEESEEESDDEDLIDGDDDDDQEDEIDQDDGNK